MIEIKATKLASFVDKISTGNLVTEALLNFEEDGVNVIAGDGNIMVLKAKLEKVAFDKYDAIGKVVIKDLGKFSTYVSLFKEEVIKISIDNTLIALKGSSKTVKATLMAPDLYDKSLAIPTTLEYNNVLALPKEVVTSILRNVSASKTESIEFKATNNDKTLSISVGQNDTIIERLGLETVVDNATTKFGVAAIKIISALTEENANFGIKDNYPLSVTEKSTEMSVRWILAPLVDPDEEEKEE